MASHQEVILLREVVRVVSEGHSILYEDGVTRLLTTRQLLQPQGQDSSSALERDGLIERQLMWILQQIQRAELGTSVTQPYLILIHAPEDGVLTRHTDVCDPHVSIVRPPNYGLLVIGHLDDMDES